MSRSVFEHAILSGAKLHAGARHTDGTHPYNFWVSASGNDGHGNGSWNNPYASVKRAIRQAANGRGDRILVMPGSYAETIDIGSGSTAGNNTNGGYAKRDLQIIGDDTLYNGRVQIVGDGSTLSPTLKVRGEYIRGFVLKNLELDTPSGLTGDNQQAALELVSDDSGASPSASDDSYRFLVENVAVRSDNPSVGVILTGATLGTLRKLRLQGPNIGLAFTGSDNNNPSDLVIEAVEFMDCVAADIACISGSQTNAMRTSIQYRSIGNITFDRTKHLDRAGTPVTNYVNFVGADVGVAAYVNVGFYGCEFARDIADNTLISAPGDVVFVRCYSPSGLESFVTA